MGYAYSSDSVSPDTPPVPGLPLYLAPAGARRRGMAASVPLRDGDAGTEQTIKLIRQVVAAGSADPLVNATVADILRGVPAYNDTAAARALFNWVLANIRFTNNPVGHEMVRSAAWTITHGIGDCNNINAELLPAMLMSIGLPVHLVTIANDPSDPQSFTHVYAEVNLDGNWTPIDAARPGASFGTAVSRYTRKRVWSLVDDRYVDLRGQLRGGHFGLGDINFLGPPVGFDTLPAVYVDPTEIPQVGPTATVSYYPPGTIISSTGDVIPPSPPNFIASILNSILKPFTAAGGAPTTKPPAAQASAVSAGSSGSSLLPLGLLAIAGFALLGGAHK